MVAISLPFVSRDNIKEGCVSALLCLLPRSQRLVRKQTKYVACLGLTNGDTTP